MRARPSLSTRAARTCTPTPARRRLRGIHKLGMRYCQRPSITDSAIEHLRGIHTQNMSGCNQPTSPSPPLSTCAAPACSTPSITHAACATMHGIRKLYISNCMNSSFERVAIK